MPFDKLYVKIKCTICRGTRVYNSGHHDPLNPLKWKTCPYCDLNGHMLIEASPGAIKEYLLSLTEEEKSVILEYDEIKIQKE